MRAIVAFAAWVALAAVVAGCTSVDGVYIREGIGVNLNTPDLPEVTDLQDVYVGEICRQAGLRVSLQNGRSYCDELGMRPREWATFVQAGMNDIDRRCDAYLAWLDNKRRWREPILKQLATTAAATAAIMGITNASVESIAIVATAFGFAQDTFVNFHSRLITEVDHTVVQTVVLGHQNEFRIQLADTPIDNRPAAIYLLRSYLRICTPFSIEMSISNTITTFHRGGPDALRAEPMLTRAPTVARASAVVRNANVPMSRPQKADRVVSPTRFGSYEESLTTKDIKDFQRAVCVAQDGDLGPLGSETRLAIKRELKASDEVLTPRKGILLRRILRGEVTCPRP
jgi:hypothetical protein